MHIYIYIASLILFMPGISTVSMCTSTVSMCTLVLLLLSAEDYYYAYIVNTTNLSSICRSVHVEGFIIHFGKPGGAFWCLSDPITLRFFLDDVLLFFEF